MKYEVPLWEKSNLTLEEAAVAGCLYRENRCRIGEYCNGFVSHGVIQWHEDTKIQR